MTRECTKCATAQPIDEFRFHKSKGRHATICKACERAYQRAWYAENQEVGRARSAASMRKLRADPNKREAHLEKQRKYYHAKGKHTEKAYYERIKASDPWGWRVRNLRRNISPAITIEWLRSTWTQQGGRCALSGRLLDIANAEVDHVVPRSRGGTDDLSNLRLVTPEANAAKSGLTDEEFFALCRDVLATHEQQIPELIGRAIASAMEVA